MAIETAAQIKQMMSLRSKKEHELKAICEGLGLDTDGTHDELCKRLLQQESNPQSDLTKPQAIPLRTRDANSNVIEGTKEAFLKWRKMIFEVGGRKEFNLLNSDGRKYSITMKYINCSPKTAKDILDRGWFLPVSHQKDLVTAIRDSADKFEFAIVQKPDSSGNQWLMLYAEAKVQK